MSELDGAERAARGWALVSILLAAFVIALVASGGCHHARVKAPSTSPTSQLPVIQVVIQPRQAVSCWVSELRDPPDEPPYPSASEEPDVLARVMVHRRDYDKLIRYVKDEHTMIASLAACVEKLREQLAEDTGTVVK